MPTNQLPRRSLDPSVRAGDHGDTSLRGQGSRRRLPAVQSGAAGNRRQGRGAHGGKGKAATVTWRATSGIYLFFFSFSFSGPTSRWMWAAARGKGRPSWRRTSPESSDWTSARSCWRWRGSAAPQTYRTGEGGGGLKKKKKIQRSDSRTFRWTSLFASL